MISMENCLCEEESYVLSEICRVASSKASANSPAINTESEKKPGRVRRYHYLIVKDTVVCRCKCVQIHISHANQQEVRRKSNYGACMQNCGFLPFSAAKFSLTCIFISVNYRLQKTGKLSLGNGYRIIFRLELRGFKSHGPFAHERRKKLNYTPKWARKWCTSMETNA